MQETLFVAILFTMLAIFGSERTYHSTLDLAEITPSQLTEKRP